MSSSSRNILYIGLHGYAGSGKDTVAKALRLMLSYPWESFEDFKKTWEQEAFKRSYATFNEGFNDDGNPVYGNATLEDTKVYCIAFADQLKHICAEMFGIPVKHFYYNKESGWIDITGTFEYVEKLPYGAKTITADDYAYMKNSNTNPDKPLWMSLREVLVYVGTYICQTFINKQVFTNGVNNKVKMVAARNRNLEYVICTDVRFYHEIEFIKQHHGINIDIVRPEVKQLDNIAEHDLDNEESFDVTIMNDSTYDALLHNLWDIVHEDKVFANETIQLMSHDGSNNYLRRISDTDWQACFEYGMSRVSYDGGEIVMIDPSGGPMLMRGEKLYNENGACKGTITSIRFDEEHGGHVIEIEE